MSDDDKNDRAQVAYETWRDAVLGVGGSPDNYDSSWKDVLRFPWEVAGWAAVAKRESVDAVEASVQYWRSRFNSEVDRAADLAEQVLTWRQRAILAEAMESSPTGGGAVVSDDRSSFAYNSPSAYSDLAKELRHAFNETADPQPESSAEFAVITLARAEERKRAADICARLAEAMENGAGELAPGNRLRQAERLIRAGESATPSASAAVSRQVERAAVPEQWILDDEEP